jgi:hypothetical protein
MSVGRKRQGKQLDFPGDFGILLSIALLAAVALLVIAAAAVWETVVGAVWLGRIW